MDLKSVICNLIESGLTEQQIAEQVKTSQPTINRIKSGKITSPRFDVGSGLVALHEKRCAKKVA